MEFCSACGTKVGLILYETEGELEVAASHGLRYPESVTDSDHVMKALRTGLKQLIKVPPNVHVGGVLTDFRPAEVGVFPIKNKGVPLGVVVLAAGKEFDADQHARIEMFMQGLGLAMNNAIVHDDLQRLAALDPLTGIYNRRFGLSRLREEFSRAVRGNSILGVMLFDIDHFKVINDTYGHLTGDRVLKNICDLAKSSLREGDILFRYGGEEFVAVLPAASSDDLKIIAERLRKSIEDSSVSDGPRKVSVTVSIGGTAFPDHDVKDEGLLIQHADDAMYQAKELGRNRIVIV